MCWLVSSSWRLLQKLGEGEGLAVLAAGFIGAVFQLRKTLELPLKSAQFSVADVEGVVTAAMAGTRNLYPVPRYFSRDEVSGLVSGLLG